MVYVGKNICSIIIFKGIFVGNFVNSYCGLVKMGFGVKGLWNYF